MKRRQRPSPAAANAATFVVALAAAIHWQAPAQHPEPALDRAPIAGPQHHAPAGPRPVDASQSPALPSDHWSDSPESDVLADRYPVSKAAFAAIRPGATLRLPGPDGGEIDLAVEEVRVGDATTHVRLSHAELPSTVTLIGDEFFATIATPTGVYALSGDGRFTRLLRHDTLDLRTLHAEDYRPVPS